MLVETYGPNSRSVGPKIKLFHLALCLEAWKTSVVKTRCSVFRLRAFVFATRLCRGSVFGLRAFVFGTSLCICSAFAKCSAWVVKLVSTFACVYRRQKWTCTDVHFYGRPTVPKRLNLRACTDVKNYRVQTSIMNVCTRSFLTSVGLHAHKFLGFGTVGKFRRFGTVGLPYDLALPGAVQRKRRRVPAQTFPSAILQSEKQFRHWPG